MNKILGKYVDCEGDWEEQRPAYKIPEPEVRDIHLLRAMNISYQRRIKFIGALFLLDGSEIRAPSIHTVTTRSTKFGHCSLVKWTFENVLLQQDVIINGLGLMDDFGFLLETECYTLPVHGRANERLTQLKIGLVPKIILSWD